MTGTRTPIPAEREISTPHVPHGNPEELVKMLLVTQPDLSLRTSSRSHEAEAVKTAPWYPSGTAA